MPDEGEGQPVFVKATEYVKRAFRTKKEVPVDVDAPIQHAMLNWDYYERFLLRLNYKFYEPALERADKAAQDGKPGLSREVGYAAAIHDVMAYLTRFAGKSGDSPAKGND